MDPCPSIQAEPEIVESAGVPVSSTQGETLVAEQADHDFVGPLEADAYFETIQAIEPTAFVAEGEEAATGAPTMWTFGGSRNGIYWVLTGTVSDDIDPSNCRVYFDGVLNGQSAAVMPDGTFWHYAYYIPGLTTVVNAVARDMQNNESNMMSVILG